MITPKLEQLDKNVERAMSSVEPKSFISVQPLAKYVANGLQMAEAKELVKYVLVEKETTILFGDTGLGKTTLAMQYGIDIAEKGVQVLYVNFELSQQQLAKKYPQKALPGNFDIATIDYSLMHDVTDQGQILAEIEAAALRNNAKVVIIDNLTNLCINSKEGAEAGVIMLKLLSLRMTHDWTMLILAHVPKRKASDPLTINDLAGSKMLSNLADNVIGLNKSKLGQADRYIIQLKYRSLPIELNEKNVMHLRLGMYDGYLHFEQLELGEERNHLPRSRDENAELEMEIAKELRIPSGLSYREIAEKLGTSLGKVQRVAESMGLKRKSKKSNE